MVFPNESLSREQNVLLSFTKMQDKVKKLSIYRYSDDDPPYRYRNAREGAFTNVSTIKY